jgi:hypothetical protein
MDLYWGVLGINFHDLAVVFGGIVWDFKTIATSIPWHVWLFIILAVGVNLLERYYLKIVNPSEFQEERSESLN